MLSILGQHANIEWYRLTIADAIPPPPSRSPSWLQRRDGSLAGALSLLSRAADGLHRVDDRICHAVSGDHAIRSLSVSYEDIVILPFVSTAFAARTLLRATLSILVGILDDVFPVVMQVARVPLFAARIIGDAITAILKGLVRFVPVSEARRAQLRRIITTQWAWLRQKINYRSFENALHRAFERGMEWVFRKCRNLTPQAALLVICGAVLWLPITFGTAVATHAILLANATALPAWMQLLHFPVAFLAKSKILVLPVYPAAWPQAKRHPLIQGIAKRYQDLKRLTVVQRTGFRYRQTEYAAQIVGKFFAHLASLVGLLYLIDTALGYVNERGIWITKTSRAAALKAVESPSQVWLIGSIVSRYATCLDDIRQLSTAKPSERIRALFERWSIKFSPEYYEAKEREEMGHLTSSLSGSERG